MAFCGTLAWGCSHHPSSSGRAGPVIKTSSFPAGEAYSCPVGLLIKVASLAGHKWGWSHSWGEEQIGRLTRHVMGRSWKWEHDRRPRLDSRLRGRLHTHTRETHEGPIGRKTQGRLENSNFEDLSAEWGALLARGAGAQPHTNRWLTTELCRHRSKP